MSLKQVFAPMICLAIFAGLTPTSWAEFSLLTAEFALSTDGSQSGDLLEGKPQRNHQRDEFLWLDFDADHTIQPRLIMDNADTEYVTPVGQWTEGTLAHGFYFDGYLAHADEGANPGSVIFSPHLPFEGMYEVFMRWPADESLSDRVPVEIKHSRGTAIVYVDQRKDGDQWNLLGRFYFAEGSVSTVTIRAGETPGIVAADAVKFQPYHTPLAALVHKTSQLSGPKNKPGINQHAVSIRPTGFDIGASSAASYGWFGGYGLNYSIGNSFHQYAPRDGYGYGGGFGSDRPAPRRDYSVFEDPGCDLPGHDFGQCDEVGGPTTITETSQANNSTASLGGDAVFTTLVSLDANAATNTSATPVSMTGVSKSQSLATASDTPLIAPLSGSLTVNNVANPEPSAGLLLALGTFLSLAFPRRARRRAR